MVKIINDYILMEQIGLGAYGSVYKAKHQQKQGLFAVKVIPVEKFQEIQKLQECMNNEVKVLSMIGTHPHIIKFHEKLKSKSNHYFIYDFCNGGTLEKYIKKYQKLSEKQALIFFSQLQSAFKVLNKHNIMHRDLKPENIFLHNGELKIGDFGFCKDLQSDDSLAKTMLGSPIYMAPQVLKGHMYTTKTDIWSLGIILYEMLYGSCPYNSKNIFDLISNIENTEIKFPDQLQISLETKNLIKKMLARDSFKRISWIELFKIQISPEGEFIKGKSTSSEIKSFSISKDPISHKYSLPTDQSPTIKFQLSLNQNKKASSLTKPEKQKVFYSQNFIQLLSSKNISIDGLNDKSYKKTTQYFEEVDRKKSEDYFKEVENRLPGKIQSIKIEKEKNSGREEKRKKIIEAHENLVKQMYRALQGLQKKGSPAIKQVYITLKQLQQRLKLMTESIQMNDLQMLDMCSTLNYEQIQMGRFVQQLKDYMLKQKIEIPAFCPTRTILNIV